MGNSFGWRLADHQAQLSRNGFGVRIDLTSPSAGMLLQKEGVELGTFFAFDGSANEGVDGFVRGDDLIANYEADERSAISGDVYWRLLPAEGDSFALEFIYSIRTDLLDSRPMPCIRCQVVTEAVPALATIYNSDEGALVREMAGSRESGNYCLCSVGGETSLAVGTIPNDLAELTVVETEGGAVVSFQLRSEFLEKGVIRRMRMLLAVASGDRSEEQVRMLAQSFVDSGLPLNT